jgi:hypothetical protein
LPACPALGLLVTSDYNKKTLSIWGVPCGANGGAGVCMHRHNATHSVYALWHRPHYSAVALVCFRVYVCVPVLCVCV